MLLICTETTRRKWVWISFLFWHPSVCVCARSCVRARTRVCETSITSPLSCLSLGLLTSQRLTVAPLSPLQPVRLHIRIRFNRENKNIYLSRYIPNIAYSLHCCCFFILYIWLYQKVCQSVIAVWSLKKQRFIWTRHRSLLRWFGFCSHIFHQ